MAFGVLLGLDERDSSSFADNRQTKEPRNHEDNHGQMNGNSRKESVRNHLQAAQDNDNHPNSQQRKFKCPWPKCAKSFSRKPDLNRHYCIHTGERPFRCPFAKCHRSFIQRSALTIHIRTHTGERPHACDLCNKSFADSSTLSRHRKIHLGVKPFACLFPQCGKRFLRRTALKIHLRTHGYGENEATALVTRAAEEAARNKAQASSAGLRNTGGQYAGGASGSNSHSRKRRSSVASTNYSGAATESNDDYGYFDDDEEDEEDEDEIMYNYLEGDEEEDEDEEEEFDEEEEEVEEEPERRSIQIRELNEKSKAKSLILKVTLPYPTSSQQGNRKKQQHEIIITEPTEYTHSASACSGTEDDDWLAPVLLSLSQNNISSNNQRMNIIEDLHLKIPTMTTNDFQSNRRRHSSASSSTSSHLPMSSYSSPNSTSSNNETIARDTSSASSITQHIISKEESTINSSSANNKIMTLLNGNDENLLPRLYPSNHPFHTGHNQGQAGNGPLPHGYPILPPSSTLFDSLPPHNPNSTNNSNTGTNNYQGSSLSSLQLQPIHNNNNLNSTFNATRAVNINSSSPCLPVVESEPARNNNKNNNSVNWVMSSWSLKIPCPSSANNTGSNSNSSVCSNSTSNPLSNPANSEPRKKNFSAPLLESSNCANNNKNYNFNNTPLRFISHMPQAGKNGTITMVASKSSDHLEEQCPKESYSDSNVVGDVILPYSANNNEREEATMRSISQSQSTSAESIPVKFISMNESVSRFF